MFQTSRWSLFHHVNFKCPIAFKGHHFIVCSSEHESAQEQRTALKKSKQSNSRADIGHYSIACSLNVPFKCPRMVPDHSFVCRLNVPKQSQTIQLYVD